MSELPLTHYKYDRPILNYLGVSVGDRFIPKYSIYEIKEYVVTRLTPDFIMLETICGDNACTTYDSIWNEYCRVKIINQKG